MDNKLELFKYEPSANNTDFLLFEMGRILPIAITLECGLSEEYRDKERAENDMKRLCKAVNNYDSLTSALLNEKNLVVSYESALNKAKIANDSLLEALHLVVGSMSLERVERFDILEKCKAAIKKAEQ